MDDFNAGLKAAVLRQEQRDQLIYEVLKDPELSENDNFEKITDSKYRRETLEQDLSYFDNTTLNSPQIITDILSILVLHKNDLLEMKNKISQSCPLPKKEEVSECSKRTKESIKHLLSVLSVDVDRYSFSTGYFNNMDQELLSDPETEVRFKTLISELQRLSSFTKTNNYNFEKMRLKSVWPRTYTEKEDFYYSIIAKLSLDRAPSTPSKLTRYVFSDILYLIIKELEATKVPLIQSIYKIVGNTFCQKINLFDEHTLLTPDTYESSSKRYPQKG